MYEVRADQQKNRLYIILKGFLSDEEVKQAAEEVIQKVQQLQPGFGIINDIAELAPASPEATGYIKQAQTAAFRHGPSKVVRVVKSAISSMQFNRLQKEAGANYETLQAQTLEEAERILDVTG